MSPLHAVVCFTILNFMLVPTVGTFPVHIHLLIPSLKHCPTCSGGSVAILHEVSLRKQARYSPCSDKFYAELLCSIGLPFSQRK